MFLTSSVKTSGFESYLSKERAVSKKAENNTRFADRLRELLNTLGRILQPTPPVPQPIPVRERSRRLDKR